MPPLTTSSTIQRSVMMMTTGIACRQQHATSTLLRVSRRRMRSLPRALSTDAKFQFRCTQCGKCCTGKGGRVRVNARERDEISALLGVSTHELTTRFLTPQDNGRRDQEDQEEEEENGAANAAQWLIRQTDDDSQCVFLRGTKCSIYQARPTQCRTFPWWPQNVISDYDWRLAARHCEGITAPATDAAASVSLDDVLPETIVYDIHRSGENFTYDELHAMLQDLKSVEPQFLNDYKQELQLKFHRQVVFQSPRVTVLDSFLDGLPPSRCFVFNDRPHLVQSEMLLGDDAPLDPSRLVLDVHQAMALALQWLPVTQCRRVAVLGSGGGSLARYVLHHTPTIERLDAVEPDAVVNDIARQFFGLDDTTDARVRLHESMGEAFVERQLEELRRRPEDRYDLVFLDVEGGEPSSDGVTAPPSTMLVPSFLENLKRLIAPHGVLVVNVIAENDNALARVARAFHDVLKPQHPHGFVLRLPRNAVFFWLGNAPDACGLTGENLRQRLVDMVSTSREHGGGVTTTQWSVSDLCRIEDVLSQ